MVQRKIEIRLAVIENIAKISTFIESKGLLVTAQKFSSQAYDFIQKLRDPKIRFIYCRDSKRRINRLKCVNYKKKYVIVFWEDDSELIIHEFILASSIH